MANIHANAANAFELISECKSRFVCLKSEIGMALKEAEEMMASMSVPLLRLIGLKEEEMHRQGRHSSIYYIQAEDQSHSTKFGGSDGCARSTEGCHDDPFKSVKKTTLINIPARGLELEEMRKKAAKFLAKIEDKRKHQLRELADALDKLEGSVNSAEKHLLSKVQLQEGQIGTLVEKFCRKVRDVDKAVQEVNSRKASTAAPDRLHIAMQSYQTLLSLTARLLPSIVDVIGVNRSSLKEDVGEMVKSVRHCMRMPLQFILQRLKGQALLIQVPELEDLMRQLQAEALSSVSFLASTTHQLQDQIKRLDSCCSQSRDEIEVMTERLAKSEKTRKETLQDVNKHKEEMATLKAMQERTVRDLSCCIDVLEALVEDQASELSVSKQTIGSLQTQLQAERKLRDILEKKKNISVAEESSVRELQQSTQLDLEKYQSLAETRGAENERLQRKIGEKVLEVERLQAELHSKQIEIMDLKRDADVAAKRAKHLQGKLTDGTVEKQRVQNELWHLKDMESQKKRCLRSRSTLTIQRRCVEDDPKVSKTFSCMFGPGHKLLSCTELLEHQIRNPNPA